MLLNNLIDFQIRNDLALIVIVVYVVMYFYQ